MRLLTLGVGAQRYRDKEDRDHLWERENRCLRRTYIFYVAPHPAYYNIWTLLQPTPRGQSRCFGITFREPSCHQSLYTVWLHSYLCQLWSALQPLLEGLNCYLMVSRGRKKKQIMDEMQDLVYFPTSNQKLSGDKPPIGMILTGYLVKTCIVLGFFSTYGM